MWCNGFLNLFNSISGFIEDGWVLFLFSVCCLIICCVASGKLFCTLVREQEGRQIMLDHFDRNDFDLVSGTLLSSWKTLWELLSEGEEGTILASWWNRYNLRKCSAQDLKTNSLLNPRSDMRFEGGRKNWVHFHFNISLLDLQRFQILELR